MTIASEISRLQCAKADMCAAIENKGVTVWNVTLSDYACCIDAIEAGWGWCYVDLLVVGWGWWGDSFAGWGGGWFIELSKYQIDGGYGIDIWMWGAIWCNWWDSHFGEIIAYWGGAWWWCAGGSWWWGWCSSCTGINQGWDACTYKINWTVYTWWHSGGAATSWCNNRDNWWWGWWWAGAIWGCRTSNCYSWSCGGAWLFSDISGECCQYAWWWGGWSCCTATTWGAWGAWGWGSWRCWSCDATYYWWWWWGNGCSHTAWCWYQWIVIVRYPTDWSYWITDWEWGCKYVCGDYVIHCYTEWWFFWPKIWFTYLIVWWWWWGNAYTNWAWWWGWWWDVKCGRVDLERWCSYPVCIWAWGAWGVYWNCGGCPWCPSCFNWIVACWWQGCTTGFVNGNPSWSWCAWGSGCGACSWGWWWWAWWKGNRVPSYLHGGTWWAWKYWYWWWGWWWGCGTTWDWWAWCDGGGDGWTLRTSQCHPWCNATNYWGWWWWGAKSSGACGAWGAGCQWVVDICYICWSHTATWGNSCYLCNWYCVHRFTSNGTFTIVS